MQYMYTTFIMAELARCLVLLLLYEARSKKPLADFKLTGGSRKLAYFSDEMVLQTLHVILPASGIPGAALPPPPPPPLPLLIKCKPEELKISELKF